MKKFLLISLLMLLGACASIERVALPQSTLLAPSFAAYEETSQARVDHAPWDEFLQNYVREDVQGINRVAYETVTEADRARLQNYLAELEDTDVNALSRDEQLAFWINLYNAETVEVILQSYPVASIRDINDGFLSFGPWDRPVTTVGGRSLTLNDIEHRIIRPVFKEPRIHYALNCAAAGCPNLMDRAWRAATLERDLTEAEHAYVNSFRGVSVAPNGSLTLSKIYIWFQEDFGANEADVLRRLQGVAEAELAAAIAAQSRVSRYQYDWSLNEF
ncbi:DUF547 domain-containing protein [Tateyamaria sp. ANG-S1]|uniref:DUF547 domain-containing protein n=1 Tax=Tateyamaria sp. ANG-S1 TaxID=1577905 RepID=UPI00057CEB6D|nr:DUF547 domain-containing protein [Tateyamaria sp. ANG-S1]KIC49539.1 hypothetical protein RA29_07575 [Tateyamaria sp. ANG-S1]